MCMQSNRKITRVAIEEEGKENQQKSTGVFGKLWENAQLLGNFPCDFPTTGVK